MKFFINNINKVYFGSTSINKIYKGSVLLYSLTASNTFDYVYKILNLTYINNIEYSIHGLDL
jgi:hypothetical protein